MSNPLATLILMTHNHERHVSAALDSAFAQDYAPLEIIVSDDASRDTTPAILHARTAAYRGPHRLRTVIQPRNLGVAGHQSACMAMAQGEVVVIADGDDIAYPQRVRRLVEAIQTHGVSCASSNARAIDADGAVIGPTSTETASRTIELETYVAQGWLPVYLGATLAFHREVIDTFGGIDPRKVPDANDHIMPMRAALMRGIRYVAEPLLDYRLLATSQTAGFADRTGTAAAYRETAIAFELGAVVMQLDQLMRVLAARPDDQRLNRARVVMTDRLTARADRWLLSRTALRNAGYHPVWRDRATLDARATHSLFDRRLELPAAPGDAPAP